MQEIDCKSGVYSKIESSQDADASDQNQQQSGIQDWESVRNWQRDTIRWVSSIERRLRGISRQKSARTSLVRSNPVKSSLDCQHVDQKRYMSGYQSQWNDAPKSEYWVVSTWDKRYWLTLDWPVAKGSRLGKTREHVHKSQLDPVWRSWWRSSRSGKTMTRKIVHPSKGTTRYSGIPSIFVNKNTSRYRYPWQTGTQD